MVGATLDELVEVIKQIDTLETELRGREYDITWETWDKVFRTKLELEELKIRRDHLDRMRDDLMELEIKKNYLIDNGALDTVVH